MTCAYTLEFDPEGFLRITLRGELQLKDIPALLNEIKPVVAAHACFRLLVNLQALELKLSVTQVYQVPDLFEEFARQSGTFISSFRRALVMDHNSDLFHFFETTSLNRGQYVRVFRDAEAARAWLLHS